MSISDISIPAGRAGCETNDPRYQSATKRPSWKEMTADSKPFTVIFDMLSDLKGVSDVGIDIPKSMSRSVQFRYGRTNLTEGKKTKQRQHVELALIRHVILSLKPMGLRQNQT